MLTKLLAMTKAELKSKIQSIDLAVVKGRAMRRQLAGMQKKQGGFTLLELLVVVAILAAIAGTATVMLQDTDRKAAAGAHVAMMDTLAKGILTFQKMNGNLYPDNWDSLESGAAGALAAATRTALLADALGNATSGMLEAHTGLTAGEAKVLTDAGITQVRVLDSSLTGDCATAASIKLSFKNKSGLTPQNIFRDNVTGSGCGATTSATIATGAVLQRWKATQNPRVNAGAADVLLAFGAGPDSSLFNPANIGALSNAPVYRHVATDEYNRFIVLFKISDVAATGGKATFQAIVDGAGDTKDEELGEVDNIRKT